MCSQASVLIYDGRNAAFRSVVDVFTYRMEDVVSVPLESDLAQRFLEAQFGGRPFVFVFVEGDSVHVGDAAVRRTLTARGIDASVARSFERLYSKFGDSFGRIVHGEAPAEINGTFTVHPDARRHLESIRCRQTGGDEIR